MSDECTENAERLLKSKKLENMTNEELAKVASCASKFIDREIAIRELAEKTDEVIEIVRDKLIKDMHSKRIIEPLPIEDEEEPVEKETDVAGDEEQPKEEASEEGEEKPRKEEEPTEEE